MTFPIRHVWFPIVALGVALVAPAPAVSPGELIDCGHDKVVIFEESAASGGTSSDGRYAIGWTIRPVDPKAKPVDWSKWNPEKWSEFFDLHQTTPVTEGTGVPYELMDCVVDLKRKRMLPLPSDWAYWPHKNHGDLKITWSRDADGVSHAVIANDARFFTSDVWLVTARDSGMRLLPLSPSLKRATDRLFEKNLPVSHDQYGVFWRAHEGTFDKSTLRLRFDAEIPKSAYGSVDGTVTVDLATGAITRVDTKMKRDDPFVDNPKLAAADKELNKAYTALMAKLNETQRTALRNEQRQWLIQRNRTSQEAASTVTEQNEDAMTQSRDKALIQSTQERTLELRKQLKGSS